MVKPKKLTQIKVLNNSTDLKTYLCNNPDKLREFVNNNIDFNDMGFDIDSKEVNCPFCNDTGHHGKVNINNNTGMHNIYCYKCSGIKNNGHSYSPWDYLTYIYRIQEGSTSFLDAVISLYNSFEDFKRAYEGHKIKINKKAPVQTKDVQQEYIDNTFKNCNGGVLAFIDKLYINKLNLSEIAEYIELYNTTECNMLNADWDGTDQNVEIFVQSQIPIKVINLKQFNNHVKNDNKFIKKLFNHNTTFLYLIPTVTPNGNIVQITFRIGDGKTEKDKPKVMKVKATFENNINIPAMFGFHNFSGFRKGIPIVLVEGEKDAIAMQTIYPYTLAMGRNTLGSSIKYLKHLTNKFVLIPDNDTAGIEGARRIKENMKTLGLKLKIITFDTLGIQDLDEIKDAADLYSHEKWNKLKEIMNRLKNKYIYK